jgi:putative nucleotidyltransferase with HDIG domain
MSLMNSSIDTTHIHFDLEDALPSAKKLYDEGQLLLKRYMEACKADVGFDEGAILNFLNSMLRMMESHPDPLLCLINTSEKDDYLYAHPINVTILAMHFAKYLGWKRKDQLDICYAAFVHDVGKIKTPDWILKKPGKLNDQEKVLMHDHVFESIDILENQGASKRIIKAVAEHHERIDGYGYPYGLRGKEIGEMGRLLAIIDIYDAMTTERTYKAAQPPHKALQLLLKMTPAQYDEQLLEQFIKCNGIYPIGSLVLLKNGHVAMVESFTSKSFARPVVRVFYSNRSQFYLPRKILNLSLPGNAIEIARAVTPREVGVDMHHYFNGTMLDQAND